MRGCQGTKFQSHSRLPHVLKVNFAQAGNVADFEAHFQAAKAAVLAVTTHIAEVWLGFNGLVFDSVYIRSPTHPLKRYRRSFLSDRID